MKIAVVGGGIIGASAAKYLAASGHDVTLFAPSEPADKSRHNGVFASHYDAGRITRHLSPNPIWSELARESIARYRQIEAQSGIGFFHECGLLVTDAAGTPFIEAVRQVRDETGIDAPEMTRSAIRAAYPWLALPDTHIGFFEARGAGYIDPRKFVAAQIALAAARGAAVIDAAVSDLDMLAGFDQILMAQGGFARMLIPELKLRVLARTIAMAEPEDDTLADMPALIYRDPDGSDPYLVPPTRFPDGKTYLKIGGEPVDMELDGRDDLIPWFQGGGSRDVFEFLRHRVQGLFPDMRFRSWHRAACIVTYSTTGLPYVARIDDRMSVATAGCGSAGKSGDEIGRIAAETVLGRADERFALDGKEAG